MKKRDRMLRVYVERKTQRVILFPHVFYMIGVYAPAGIPRETSGSATAKQVGHEAIRCFADAKKSDIDYLATRRMEALRSYWKGQGFGLPQGDADQQGPEWKEMLKKNWALTRGPLTVYRRFAIGEIIERDSSQLWYVTVLEPSDYRGGYAYGASWKIRKADGAAGLGEGILRLLNEE
jgi:hypothetical protein